jgi:hypothetical protein
MVAFFSEDSVRPTEKLHMPLLFTYLVILAMGTFTLIVLVEAAKLRGGTISGSTHAMLLEQLKYRLNNSAESFNYRVEHMKDRGVYEIQCSK